MMRIQDDGHFNGLAAPLWKSVGLNSRSSGQPAAEEAAMEWTAEQYTLTRLQKKKNW